MAMSASHRKKAEKYFWKSTNSINMQFWKTVKYEFT